jgi:1,4-alpha-glucan branching enzyme
MQSLIRDLNTLYRTSPALHARDCEPEGFDWLIADDHENSVYAWLRKSGGSDSSLAVISNFTPVPRESYRLPLPAGGRWIERVNTDAPAYGGTGQGNLGAITATQTPSHGRPFSANILVPPMATLIFEHAGS